MKFSRFLQFAFVFSITFQSFAFASGFDLTISHGSRQGGLGGQQIAISEDAYAPFYNPAAMMGVGRFQLATSFAPLFIQYDAPIGSADASRSSDVSLAPLFFLGGVYRITDRIVSGIAIYPTALQGGKFSNVDYSDGLSDRSLEQAIYRIEASPSLSYELTDHFSVGASWRLGMMKLQSKSGVFAGTAGLTSESDVSAWDFKGMKFGVHGSSIAGFNFGLTYRPRLSTSLKGKTDLEEDDLGLLGVPEVNDIPTSVSLKIPAQLQASASYELIPNRFLMAFTWEYTWNSVVERLTLINRTTGTTLLESETDWKDSNTFHLGGEYSFRLKSQRTLRMSAGLAFDQATTRSTLPNPVGPSANHYIGYTAGAQLLQGDHTIGLAANYGSYSKRSTTVPAGNSVFAGVYKTTAFMMIADYQLSF